MNQIAGDLINKSTIVPSIASPATYEPKPKQMIAISRASLCFAIGVPFEKVRLAKFSSLNKDMIIINTDEGIPKIPIKKHNCTIQSPRRSIFAPEAYKLTPIKSQKLKHHCHDSTDPHVWTSPILVKSIAGNMANALINLEPNNKHIYLNNLHKFKFMLDSLHNEIVTLMEGKKNSKFMVFHPLWEFLADTYDLTQIVTEIEGKAPKSAQLLELISYAKKRGLKIIFAQPQFSEISAKTIANAIGGKVVLADPLAHDRINSIRNQATQFSLASK